jgi:BMFP domain-containing protein YqiC
MAGTIISDPRRAPQERHMNQEALISDFIERLQQQLDELIPHQTIAAVLDQARRTLRQGFAEFDLVPRRELEAQLAALDSLRRTVEDLERRIGKLERAEAPPRHGDDRR